MNDAQEAAGEVLLAAKELMDKSLAKNHRFLRQFEQNYFSNDELKRFALAWYHTARRHKEAFPAIVWNTPDDGVRFDLVNILYEEYGNGDPQMIHARLLLRFLRALGITDEMISNAVMPESITYFGDQVLRTWKDDDPAKAFGLHFALEYLAASLHKHFADGLAKYGFLRDEDRTYFDYHKIAEEHHADHSEAGYLHYAMVPANIRALDEGVHLGIELLSCLWDAFESFVLGSQKSLDARPAVV